MHLNRLDSPLLDNYDLFRNKPKRVHNSSRLIPQIRIEKSIVLTLHDNYAYSIINYYSKLASDSNMYE